MTKKDFERLAAVVSEMGSNPKYADAAAWLADRLANIASDTNPRFDYARFLRACGVEK